MTVAVTCIHCEATYSVSEDWLGRTARCKRCGHAFTLASHDAGSSHDACHSDAGDTGTSSAVDTGGAVAGGPRRRLGERIGRFSIWMHLGSGAFGEVYQAQDTLLKRDVALKLPHQSAFASESQRARFLREPQAAAGLRHPNIVPIYDAGVENGQFYIASAFIDGQVLQRRLEERRPDFQQAATLTITLAEALHYAHGEGIVHRDIKPANVMLDGKGEPLVMDFGLARLRETEDQLTHDGSVLGTPAYMAPEQAAARHDEVGPVSDQYSLGVMLYEMLCGERPFEGPAAAVVSMVIHQDPPSPRTREPAVPRDLETICQKAMAKRPQDRYASCGELAGDLRRWLNNEPIRARRVGLAERLTRWACAASRGWRRWQCASCWCWWVASWRRACLPCGRSRTPRWPVPARKPSGRRNSKPRRMPSRQKRPGNRKSSRPKRRRKRLKSPKNKRNAPTGSPLKRQLPRRMPNARPKRRKSARTGGEDRFRSRESHGKSDLRQRKATGRQRRECPPPSRSGGERAAPKHPALRDQDEQRDAGPRTKRPAGRRTAPRGNDTGVQRPGGPAKLRLVLSGGPVRISWAAQGAAAVQRAYLRPRSGRASSNRRAGWRHLRRLRCERIASRVGHNDVAIPLPAGGVCVCLPHGAARIWLPDGTARAGSEHSDGAAEAQDEH